jgi:uncharacterized protein (DUF2384 family)
MALQTQAQQSFDHRDIARVATSTFFNIMEKWSVKNDHQKVLLGQPSNGTFYTWKKSQVVKLPHDTLERISYVMGIYKSLAIIFTNKTQANDWINKPNERFDGKSALEYMLNGSIIHLADVRRYLDAQRG